jgi:hypothetical protein
MCGRVKLPEDVSLTKELLKIQWDRLRDYEPRYNVPPTTMAGSGARRAQRASAGGSGMFTSDLLLGCGDCFSTRRADNFPGARAKNVSLRL